MNIDKQKMATAFDRRAEPEYNQELMGYFEQMSNYFAGKFAIKMSDRDDLKQEALIVAVKALEKYDTTKKSTPFSYFYKVFHVAFMYHLRKQKMKKDRRPVTCSIENYTNLSSGEYEVIDHEDEIMTVNGKTYNRNELFSMVKEGAKLAKKAMKLTPAKRIKLIEEGTRPFVKEFAYEYIKKRSRKK